MALLFISGSTRAASTNSAFVRTAAAIDPDVVAYEGLTALPHFDPDLDAEPLPAPVAELRAAIASADAIVFCTPEYAGTLPGSFKNLLDWTVGGSEMPGKRAAWVNVAADPRRGGGATETLRTVLGYVQADVVADACRHIGVERGAVGPDGLLADESVRDGIRDVIATLRAH